MRTAELLVDGAVVAGRAADCSFALPVPCPLSESGTLALDTTRLAEGEHEVKLVVADATLANRAQHGPFTITVDNLPAPAATTAPRISGGATLHGDDGTWTGANLTFDRRWQRLEDGTWQDVAAGHRSTRRAPTTRAIGCGSGSGRATRRARARPSPSRPLACPLTAHAHRDPGADRRAARPTRDAGRGRRAARHRRAAPRPAGVARQAERGVRRDRSPDRHAALG